MVALKPLSNILTKYKVSDDIKYHVACLSDHEEEFEHNQARCFKVQSA